MLGAEVWRLSVSFKNVIYLEKRESLCKSPCFILSRPSPMHYVFQFSPVQSLSRVQLFATPWTAARQASLSITKSWSLPVFKEESEKVGLKLNIQKTKIMASGPTTSWQTDGETMETVRDKRLYFFGLQNPCRWWLQSWNYKMLAPWKKSYDQPRQHIKKQRHYFANKGPSSQSNGFSSSHIWIWELTIKKAECWRINVFELWCWRRLLRVPWTARRSNQPILKEISPEYSL